MKYSEIFHCVGRLDDVCPSCETDLKKRPQRKTKCPHCGEYIYSRTRPYDNHKVLLNESQAKIVEKDWEFDYELKQSLPKEIDPVWAERIEVARRTKCDLDPIVERLAREAYGEWLSLMREGMSPIEAQDLLLPPDAKDELSKRVGIRFWQLQIQSVFGVDF